MDVLVRFKNNTYKKNIIKLIKNIFCGTIFMISMSVAADWVNPPHEILLEESDLVVFGKFLADGSTHQSTVDLDKTVGLIQVESVLKGEADSGVLLLLPAKRLNGLVSSTDIIVKDGQQGIWYLKKTPTSGIYSIKQPYHFVQTDKMTAPF